MSEWWKYRISDFLLFSPRTYYRMIERYNEALWPVQVLMLLIGAALLWLLYSPASGRVRQRMASGLLATIWAFVAVAFLWKRYATINWAASYYAWLFAIEAVLLAGVTFRPGRDVPSKVGVGLFVLSVTLYPLLAPLLGRTWRGAEMFGVAPDPTVLATLGLLVMAEGPLRSWSMVIPLLWCVVSWATRWAMGSPEAWLLALTPVVVLGVQWKRTAELVTPVTPTPPGNR